MSKSARGLVLLPSLLFVAAVAAGEGGAVPAYLDRARPADARAHDLVRRLTLDEKASQMQNHSVGIPRLQLPAYNWWSEALHGVLSLRSATTVFPEPIGLAASFDPALVGRMGDVIATEGRIRHREALLEGSDLTFAGLTFFSPNINLFRDPRWGRGQETYGEDPLLTARMGVAFIHGLQGDDPAHPKVVATAKHYAVHSGPEPLRHGFNVDVSPHDLEDSYLPAFRAAVVDGHVASVMCVYNAVDGVPGCASAPLLDATLRKAWGFRGYVVSDCDAVADISEHHHYVGSTVEARAAAVKAGMDNECKASAADFGAPVPPESSWHEYAEAVRKGKLAEVDLDRALERSLRWRFALGMFDPPGDNALNRLPSTEADSDEQRALALQAARESMVLLANDGTLPLAGTLQDVAVVGPLADQRSVLYGNYAGSPSRSTTVLEGMRRQFPSARVHYARGSDFPGEPASPPAAWLSTTGGRAGLTVEYFKGAVAEGIALAKGTASSVNINPGSGVPADAPAGTYTIRWTGTLTPATSGRYRVGLAGESSTLRIDGKLVADKRAGMLSGPLTQELPLEAGHSYAIEVVSYPGLVHATRLLCDLVETPQQQVNSAVDAARQSDVVVAVVGITSQLEGEESAVELPGFKGGDRTSLDLPAQEQALLEALKATGKPLVVVLMNGSALSVNWAAAHANAILEAWYPGEEGGTAIAETLAGANNPAGRLPVTFYKGVEQLPPFEDYSMAHRTYRYFEGEPLFPFGFGLSYSSFAYNGLSLAATNIEAGQGDAVSVLVQNTSQRDGDEVVQLYLGFPQADGAPLRALRAFERVHLKAGESRRVRLELGKRELSHVDARGRHVITPGRYRVSVGGGQPGPGAATATLQVRGNRQLPR
jgi:beta-glucosidase